MALTDRAWRLALVVADHAIGGVSGRVRAVCRYGITLIDSGGGQEFQALVRHRLRRALGRRTAETGRVPSGAGIAIDARTERLNNDGTVVSKPSLRFPSDAPLLATVVIPCYNYGAYLDEAVRSVCQQTLTSLEVIVVDDGSDDPATRAVLEHLLSDSPKAVPTGVSRDQRVRVIRQDNRGLAAARNRGIESARGEYVCCLDADDTIAPTYLEQAIAVLETDAAAGFVSSWVQFFGDDSSVWRTEDFDPERALIGNFTSVAAVFRRDDWQLAGGYSPTMAGGFEDWEFWIRLASLGRRGRTIARPLFRHRRHGLTMTHTAKARELELRARMRSLCPAFYEDREVRSRISRLVAKTDSSHSLATLTGSIVPPSDQKPGLLVVVTGLLEGGAHSMLRDVLDGVHGHRHIVVVTTGDGTHALEDAFATMTRDIFHLHGFLAPSEWWAFVAHLIASRRVTTVLSSDCLWWLDRLDDVRRRHPALGLFDIIHNHVPTSTFRSGIAHSRSLDRHVVVSQAITSALTAAGVPRERIVEIPNGVDTAMFDPARKDRASARQALGVDPDTLLLVWAGRLSEEKRPALFVDLVATLSKRINIRGLIVGAGPLGASVEDAIDAAALRPWIGRRGHVPRADMAGLYAAADLFVLTSRVEGLPLVVLESLAMGCPVAATDVGDVRRAVSDGVNGFLVAVDSVPALADRIAGWSHDPAKRSEMRHAAAATIRDSPYQAERMCAAYNRLLLTSAIHDPGTR